MEGTSVQPDNTAVRTALWRALHVQADAQPHILEDEVGFRLIAPPADWRQRPDMDLEFTGRLRASMVARARFVEDLVTEACSRDVGQYVLLGAGLDSFVQRRPELAAQMQVYEIDQPDTQIWKQQRLKALGFGIPENLHFVSVDFETDSWWKRLVTAGFDSGKPAVVTCTGVSLYLTKEAIRATLRSLSGLAPGSLLAMTFYLPMELMDPADQPLQAISEKGARAAGTPFISFFRPEEIRQLAQEAGFKNIETVSSKDLAQRYFAGRSDGLYPASGEEFLLART